LKNLGVPSELKNRDTMSDERHGSLFGTIKSNMGVDPNYSQSPGSVLPQGTTAPTSVPDEEDKSDMEEIEN
jgi:hypothetical protein